MSNVTMEMKDLTVVKRDGRIVVFDKTKIMRAIQKSFIAVDNDLTDYAVQKSENIAGYIEEKVISTEDPLTIEQIQDLVENGLMSTKRKDVARAYITYRNERSLVRERNSQLMKTIADKINARNVLNQNANVDEYSFGGRMGEANSATMKKYALDYVLSPMARHNHLYNIIYTHDLDHYAVGSHNCLSIPFDKLLKYGFNTRQTDIRPANSVGTAFQLLAVIFQLQSLQQFGGVSATHLDWTMVPYVRKTFVKKYIFAYISGLDEFYELDILNMDDDELEKWYEDNKQKYLDELGLEEKDFYFDNKDNLDPKLYQKALFETRKETYQAAEGMYHNLNTLQSRSGNQLPFTSVNYGTCTLPEGRLVIKALLTGSIKGVGKLHKTSIFPCGIFQSMRGVNQKPGDPNYDLFRLALKSTAQRLYPNYANVDWSGNKGYDRNDPRTYFSTMGKRKLQPIQNRLNLAYRV